MLQGGLLRTFACIGALFSCTSVGLADEPDQIVFQQAGWTVAAMRKQGVFLGCYASKDFQSGTRWVFARYRNDKWMGLVGEHGGRAQNVGHLELAVDGQPIHAADVPSSAQLSRLGEMSDDAIKAIADGHVLKLSTWAGGVAFDLSGSEDALNRTMECVDAFEKQERQQEMQVFSVASNVTDGILNMRTGAGVQYPIVTSIPAGSVGIESDKTCPSSDAGWCLVRWASYVGWVHASGLQIGTVAPRQAQSSPTVAPVPARQIEAEYLPPAESLLLLTNLLNAAQIGAYRIDPPTDKNREITFAMPDGGRGLFIAARGKDTKSAEEYASIVIAKYASICQGGFMSGKQPVPSTDGSMVRQITTTCSTGDGGYVTESTIIRRQNGFMMEITQTYPAGFTPNEKAQPNQKSKSAIVDAALRLP
jgi:hypothetical protein